MIGATRLKLNLTLGAPRWAGASLEARLAAALDGHSDSFMLLAGDGSLKQTYGGAAAADTETVGWLTDKAQMGGRTLTAFLAGQPELIVNGGFDADTTGWNTQDANITLSAASGELRVGIAGLSDYAWQSVAVPAGKYYAITAYARAGSNVTGTYLDIRENGGATVLLQTPQIAEGTHSAIVKTSMSDLIIRLRSQKSTTPASSFWDDVSVKAIPGNHFASPADANRGTLAVSGGVTSVAHDGSSTKFRNTSLPFASCTDHRLLWRLKLGAGEANGILVGGAENASPYTGQFISGNATSYDGGTGLALSVDAVTVSPTTKGRALHRTEHGRLRHHRGSRRLVRALGAVAEPLRKRSHQLVAPDLRPEQRPDGRHADQGARPAGGGGAVIRGAGGRRAARGAETARERPGRPAAVPTRKILRTRNRTHPRRATAPCRPAGSAPLRSAAPEPAAAAPGAGTPGLTGVRPPPPSRRWYPGRMNRPARAAGVTHRQERTSDAHPAAREIPGETGQPRQGLHRGQDR